MRKRIYLSLLTIGMACMIIAIVISTWMFWKTTREEADVEMQSAIAMISTAMTHDADPAAYLQQIADAEHGQLRITWIGTDGNIKFESDYDAAEMENHLQRPEVQQALAHGTGSAIRESATIKKDLYYSAQELPDGTILRISIARDTMYSHILNLLPIAIALFLLACLGCIKAARVLTASLLLPLRKTAHIMESIGTPSQELPQELPHVYRELRPLVQKIMDQSNYINHTIQTLEEERNTIRIILENLQEGVILTDKNDKVLALNTCAKDILQIHRTTIITGLSLDKILPDAGCSQVRCNEDFPMASMRKLTRNGRLYQLTARPIYKDKAFYGALFILYDVTESEHREQLRREFTSNVSHELKTPLTSINGFAEMLAAGLYEKKNDVKHFGQLIQQESQRLLKLIEGIIHLTKIEESRPDAGMVPVKLKEITEDIVSFMEPVTQEKKVTVHLAMEDVSVVGNKGMLRELCMNLIDNAVKYNRPGGHVYVNLAGKEGGVLFSVRDTGIGIPEDKQKRVFERFYRVEVSRSKKNGGSGLGLSIVKHIVEQHQGRIIMESKEGEGTKITIYLPAITV